MTDIDIDELSAILLDANNEGRIGADDLLRALEKHGWQLLLALEKHGGQIAKARARREIARPASAPLTKI